MRRVYEWDIAFVFIMCKGRENQAKWMIILWTWIISSDENKWGEISQKIINFVQKINRNVANTWSWSSLLLDSLLSSGDELKSMFSKCCGSAFVCRSSMVNQIYFAMIQTEKNTLFHFRHKWNFPQINNFLFCSYKTFCNTIDDTRKKNYRSLHVFYATLH